MPTSYTCDGRDLSLPVRWRAVPAGTAEIAIFIVNLKPFAGRLFIDWAIVDVDPAAGEIAAGAVPPGAVVGRNDFGTIGYSICPPVGAREYYVVQVLGLPRRVRARPGTSAWTLYQQVRRIAATIGFTGGEYKRLGPTPGM